MSRDSQRFQTGLEWLARLDEHALENLDAGPGQIAPDLVEHTVAFAYGDVFADPRLAPLERQVVTIAALAALGNAAPQLGFHINGALNLGMRPEQVVEIIYLVAVFAGFPAGINAVNVAREVFSRRGVSVEPSTPPSDADRPSRRDRGEGALRATSQGSGAQVLESLEDIAPDLGAFILDFAYGDVIAREGISPQWKELAMIAAAAARGTMAPQLAVHLRAAPNVGCTPDQLAAVVTHIAVYAGFPAAINAAGVLKEVVGDA